MDKPLKIEVVAHVLGSMDHCSHCQVFLEGAGMGQQIHQADMDSYPPEWMDEWKQLSDVIFKVQEQYAGQLVIQITDAQSPQAMWKAIRQGIRKYPTFIVGGEKYQGLEKDRISDLIDRHLPERTG